MLKQIGLGLLFIINCMLLANSTGYAIYPLDKFEQIDRKAQISCLTEAIYHEARGEGPAGWYATAMVILNRRDSNAYPPTICAVVHQGKKRADRPIKHLCQFSYYCDGIPETFEEHDVYLRIHQLAVAIYRGNLYDITNGATHYHTTQVDPYWNKQMKSTMKLNETIYYKRK